MGKHDDYDEDTRAIWVMVGVVVAAILLLVVMIAINALTGGPQ